MAQYIDKSALVAEIERRRKLVSDPILSGDDLMIGERNALFNLLSFIDTLEVKEVDNVWHEASETPKGAGDKEILVQFSDWHTSVLEIDDWEYLDHQTKWAYLKDLI